MSEVEFLRSQLKSLHRRVDDVLENTTQEHFNWQPPGSSNPIGTIFLHMQNAEDIHIQSILQGKPRVWETGRWGDRFGLSTPPGQGRYWDEAREQQLERSDLLDYQSSVRQATLTYLDQLTVEKLNETIMFHGEELPAFEVLAGLVIHLAGHAGELAALKGMQGLRGLPF